MACCIHSLILGGVTTTVEEDSFDDGERALAEILENHRAAGRTVREGLHDGHPAWHVVTVDGSDYAVFWLTPAIDLPQEL